MIYLITNEVEKFCKIGFSNNPEARIQQLQTGNPFKLELSSVIDGDITMEKELHEKFKHLKLQGEWFNYTDEIRNFFNVESYQCIRTTEGVDWVLKFTGNEIQMIVLLVSIENSKTGLIYLSESNKKYLIDKFNSSERYIREIIKSLVDKDAVFKINSRELIVNPLYVYKNGLAPFKQKYQTYLRYKEADLI